MVEAGKRDAAISQLRRGVIEFCVLSLLAEGERYGVELVHRLAQEQALTTTEGTLYPLLSRLRREGAVETSWQESSAGPPRRYYRMTPAGRTSLAAFREEWGRFRDSVDAILQIGEPQ